jgi:hypothetical protein
VVTYFHEEQRFRESWLWLAIAIPIAIAVWFLLTTPGVPASASLLVVIVGIAVGALFAIARLETTVTGDDVVVRLHGLWPTRRVRLDDIAEVAPMRYTMWDSGGWGVHFGLAGMTYNVSGNDGVHFVLKDGRRILVGTQQPAEFAAAVAQAMRARGAR